MDFWNQVTQIKYEPIRMCRLSCGRYKLQIEETIECKAWVWFAEDFYTELVLLDYGHAGESEQRRVRVEESSSECDGGVVEKEGWV